LLTRSILEIEARLRAALTELFASANASASARTNYLIQLLKSGPGVFTPGTNATRRAVGLAVFPAPAAPLWLKGQLESAPLYGASFARQPLLQESFSALRIQGVNSRKDGVERARLPACARVPRSSTARRRRRSLQPSADGPLRGLRRRAIRPAFSPAVPPIAALGPPAPLRSARLLLDLTTEGIPPRSIRVDPRSWLLALALGLCLYLYADYGPLIGEAQAEDRSARVERPRALVERIEKPRPA
jgi:hypothetical protein